MWIGGANQELFLPTGTNSQVHTAYYWSSVDASITTVAASYHLHFYHSQVSGCYERFVIILHICTLSAPRGICHSNDFLFLQVTVEHAELHTHYVMCQLVCSTTVGVSGLSQDREQGMFRGEVCLWLSSYPSHRLSVQSLLCCSNTCCWLCSCGCWWRVWSCMLHWWECLLLILDDTLLASPSQAMVSGKLVTDQ